MCNSKLATLTKQRNNFKHMLLDKNPSCGKGFHNFVIHKACMMKYQITDRPGIILLCTNVFFFEYKQKMLILCCISSFICCSMDVIPASSAENFDFVDPAPHLWYGHHQCQPHRCSSPTFDVEPACLQISLLFTGKQFIHVMSPN